VGRHSAPDDDEGDLLVEAPSASAAPSASSASSASSRPLPRPRHAAVDDALVDTDVIEPELVERPPQPSQLAVIDAVVVEDERLPVPVSLTKPAPSPALDPAPADATAPAGIAKERPTRVDLRLLRQDGALRARAAAALLVPFVLYTVVLTIIGRFDAYLFWIWIPAILAGVLFGAQLDAAVGRAKDQGTSNSPAPDPSAPA
jgi:hypothetical protein